MAVLERVVARLAGKYIAERVQLAVKENDAAWAVLVDRAAGPADLRFYERQERLADALEAWRVNALVRRIVGAFGRLHDKGLIRDPGLLDVCYRFAGELVDVEAVLERAKGPPGQR